VVIVVWNEMLIALMMTSGSDSRTWPVGLRLMVGEFQLPFGEIAAGGLIGCLPVMILFVLVNRRLALAGTRAPIA
jgi:multiple sugar transport system permease protein